MRRFYSVLVGLMALASWPLFAQDGGGELDGLFDDPPGDIEAAAPAVDHRAAFERWDGLRWSGSFSTEGGIAAGWADWPRLGDPGQGFDGSIGLSSSASLSFSARPSPEFSIAGTLNTSFNPLLPGQGSWSPPAIDTLYADYILADALYTRMGKFGVAWGQGRLFNPANLVADSGAGYALRLSLPAYAGAQFIGLVPPAGAASYRQLHYAAKADFVLAGTYLSPALRFSFDQPVRAALSVKRVAFKTDLLADAALRYDYRVGRVDDAQLLAGFFREWADFKLYGEYQLGYLPGAATDHRLGLVAGYNNLGDSPVDLGFEYRHFFADGSGSLVLGLTGPIAPNLSWKLGAPLFYGAADSLAHSYLRGHDPAGRRISLAFGLSLSASF